MRSLTILVAIVCGLLAFEDAMTSYLLVDVEENKGKYKSNTFIIESAIIFSVVYNSRKLISLSYIISTKFN